MLVLNSVLLVNLVNIYFTIPEVYITDCGAQFMFGLLKQNLFELEPTHVLTILYIRQFVKSPNSFAHRNCIGYVKYTNKSRFLNNGNHCNWDGILTGI